MNLELLNEVSIYNLNSCFQDNQNCSSKLNPGSLLIDQQA